MVLHGWALAAEGRVEDGLSEIRNSLAGQLAAGALIARPQFLAILADACLRAGRHDEVLAATTEGLDCSAATGDVYWDSELQRVRGEALHRLSPGATEIDACFHRAIAEARAHGAKSLELRATTSAARVWASRGARAEAREMLAQIYASFTEGFRTADLIAARSLLDSLA